MALRTAMGWAIIQSSSKVLASFLSIKLTAFFLGPTGLALVGQAGNFVSFMHGFCTNATQTELVKLTAKSDPSKLSAIWSTALRLSVGLSAVVAIAVALNARPLAHWLFRNEGYWWVVLCTACSLPLLAVSSTLIGILTGLKKISLVGLTNSLAAVLGAAIFVPLTVFYGIAGGLAGTVAAYLSTLCVASAFLVVMVRRGARVASTAILRAPWDRQYAVGVVVLFPVLLIHGVSELLTPLVLRELLARELGYDQAGIWQAVLKISDTYTLLLTSAMSMYLMPHLAKLRAAELNRALVNIVVKACALSGFCALLIWLFRDWIVAILLTDRFAAVSGLITFQLVGDVFRMGCWPLRMALMISEKLSLYIVIDLMILTAQIGLSLIWINALGVEAVTIAYALTFAMVFIVLLMLNFPQARGGAML